MMFKKVGGTMYIAFDLFERNSIIKGLRTSIGQKRRMLDLTMCPRKYLLRSEEIKQCEMVLKDLTEAYHEEIPVHTKSK